ncbi:hypothetical protein AbraIFM66950_002228 [Aspergillus brasiliensis]|nr:hypothetical protein AbraIFM66950_002228 [Aspergillus brasiliensis]
MSKPGTKFPLEGNTRIEGEVSEALDKAYIPNFIWGQGVHLMMGIEDNWDTPSWVVPDHLIDYAARVLSHVFKPGTPYSEREPSQRKTPTPGEYCFDYGVFGVQEIHLHKKSSRCPSFPDPPLDIPSKNDQYYMLTKDRRLPMEHVGKVRDVPPGYSYPVKMPVPARYVESLVMFCAWNLSVVDLPHPWYDTLVYLARGMFLGSTNYSYVEPKELQYPFDKFMRILSYDASRYGEGLTSDLCHRKSYRFLCEMLMVLREMSQVQRKMDKSLRYWPPMAQDLKAKCEAMKLEYECPQEPDAVPMVHHELVAALAKKSWSYSTVECANT